MFPGSRRRYVIRNEEEKRKIIGIECTYNAVEDQVQPKEGLILPLAYCSPNHQGGYDHKTYTTNDNLNNTLHMLQPQQAREAHR